MNLGSQRTNLFHAAAVYALAVCQPAANDLLLQLVYALAKVSAVLFLVLFVQSCFKLVNDSAHAGVTNGLVVGIHSNLELVVAGCLELVEQVVVDVMMLVLELRLADLVLDGLDECADLLQLLMCFHESIEHVVLRNFLCTGLDHNDLVLGSAQGNVHLGSSALLGGRVDNGLAVNDANLAAGYNVVERNIRDRNRDGSAQQSNYLRRVVVVVLQNGADDGNVVAQVLREQRTHRTVDLTRGQDRLLGRTALTAHERAGNAAYCVHTLLKVNGEREKVDAVTRLSGCGSSNENSGLAVANQAGAVSELCHLAGLDGQLAAGDLGLKNAVVFEVKVVDVCHFVSSFNRLGRAAAAFLALETKTKRNGKWRIAVSRKESAIFHFQFQIMLCMIWSLFQLLKSDNAAQLKIQKQGSRLLPYFRIFLLTDTQLSDQGTVTVDVLLLQVSQHRTALTNHLQQTAARVVILLVYLQVLGQLLDAGGQDCNLNLRGTGVGSVGTVCLDNGSLVFLTDHVGSSPFINKILLTHRPGRGLVNGGDKNAPFVRQLSAGRKYIYITMKMTVCKAIFADFSIKSRKQTRV